MRELNILTAATFVALSLPTLSQAATLTFDGPICGGAQCVVYEQSIDQTYGDMMGVDVEYDAIPGKPGLQGLQYWDNDYSGLTNVAYDYHNAGATISFLAAVGYTVSLGGLDLGSWANEDRIGGFSITDLFDGSEAFNSGLVTVSGATASTFDFSYSSRVGLRISFLGNFDSVGVDNIVYDAVPSPVPLPASSLLLMGGLAGLAALRRRRSV